MKRIASNRTLLFALAIAAAAGACGDKNEDGASAGKAASAKGGAGSLEAVAGKAGEVNAAVTGDLAGKIEFEAQKSDKDRVAALVPKGWEESSIPGSYRPSDDADLGFMTRYSVGTNCDGTCAPKDWAEAANKVEFDQFTSGSQFEVVSDEPLDGSGRMLVAKSGRSVYVVAARWQDSASRYAYCRATLDDRAAAAADAFVAACRAMQVLAWK